MCIQHTLVCRLCEQSLANAESPERSQKPPKNRDSGAFWGFPIWARSKVSDIWGRDPGKRPFFGPCAILRFRPVRTTNIVDVCPIMCNQSSYNDDKNMCDPGFGSVRHVGSVTRGCGTEWGIGESGVVGFWGHGGLDFLQY